MGEGEALPKLLTPHSSLKRSVTFQQIKKSNFVADFVANFVANTDWDLFWPVHVVGLILGIVGLVLGAAGRKNATQRGVATAGMIIGIVGVSLNAIFMLACASAYATASSAVDSLLG